MKLPGIFFCGNIDIMLLNSSSVFGNIKEGTVGMSNFKLEIITVYVY